MAGHRDLDLESKLQSAIDHGRSVWVIGDVHGYFRTLEALLVKLQLSSDDVVLFLGDLIDKGPDSKSVMELVSTTTNFYSIRGNHEEMMRLSLDPKHRGRMKKSWLRYGGKETLLSFDTNQESAVNQAKNWIEFIEEMPTEIVLNEFRIVHAGFNPDKGIDDQSNRDRMWDREIFQSGNIFDKSRQIIVGHTPFQNLPNSSDSNYWTSESKLRDGRPELICLDGGVFLSQENSCLIALNLGSGVSFKQPRLEDETFTAQ